MLHVIVIISIFLYHPIFINYHVFYDDILYGFHENLIKYHFIIFYEIFMQLLFSYFLLY